MRTLIAVLCVTFFCSHLVAEDITVEKLEGKVRIEVDGDVYTEYVYEGEAKPYLYPVTGPDGLNMVRHFPMKKNVEGEAYDHVHHRGIWFAHGSVNGHDFWEEKKGHARIETKEVVAAEVVDNVGIVTSKNNWVTSEGEVVCTETRTLRFSASEDQRIIDFDITIHASQGKVTFGDTKEGSMAIRLNPALRVSGKVATGTLITSEGHRNGAVWGKRAPWAATYGKVEDTTVGVAIFDHPQNPRNPTWWHARNYGLFAANPFGQHDFERKPAGTGDYTIEEGETLQLRYRFVFFKGNAEEAGVAKLYEDYAKQAKADDTTADNTSDKSPECTAATAAAAAE